MRLFSRDYSQVTVTAFYALSLAEYHMNTHTHDSCEIMYVTGGACRILLPDGERTLKEKEFIFLNAQIPHCLVISPSSPCSLLNLEFHCDSAEAAIDIWDAAQESPVLLSFLRGFQDYSVGYDNGSLGYAVKDLIRHLEKNMTFSPDSAHQTFLTRLLFFRFLLELSDCLIHPRKETGMIYLRKACAYISSHLTEENPYSPAGGPRRSQQILSAGAVRQIHEQHHHRLHQSEASGTGGIPPHQQFSDHNRYRFSLRIQQQAAFCQNFPQIPSAQPQGLPPAPRKIHDHLHRIRTISFGNREEAGTTCP